MRRIHGEGEVRMRVAGTQVGLRRPLTNKKFTSQDPYHPRSGSLRFNCTRICIIAGTLFGL